MKVAHLPAFKFNLGSHGLKTSWLIKTDDHDKHQWRCKVMEYIVQNSQKEWPFVTQRHQITCWSHALFKPLDEIG